MGAWMHRTEHLSSLLPVSGINDRVVKGWNVIRVAPLNRKCPEGSVDRPGKDTAPAMPEQSGEPKLQPRLGNGREGAGNHHNELFRIAGDFRNGELNRLQYTSRYVRVDAHGLERGADDLA